MKVLITNLIDASNAISHSDGLAVYGQVKKALRNKEDAIISFEGINRVSTAFLNACIGKMILDGSFEEKIIDRSSTKEMILRKLDSVIENAKNYRNYDRIVDDATALC